MAAMLLDAWSVRTTAGRQARNLHCDGRRMASTLHSLGKAPYALACWAGVAGRGRRRGARILVGHGTPAAAAPALERQLRYLRRQFRVLPLAELVDRLDDQEADLDGCIALTFDDGLRSNVEIAYPVLRRLGIPATFFVCPRLVDEGRWIWTHEARWRLRAMAQSPDMVEAIKPLDLPSRQATESGLRRATPALVPGTADREAYDLAGWDELRALDPSIVTLGSHTMTHPILPSLPDESLETEVEGSRALLEERLQRRVDLFCYPDGAADRRVVDCVRRHYRAAVGTGQEALGRGSDRYRLPRLHLPGGALQLASRIHAAAA
jgi:peptidoglycan/xylan/chitin deacetylase (PgdA/CDA1 family)